MKPNTAVFHSCTITANIWENNKQQKAKNSTKAQLKTRNRVLIFFGKSLGLLLPLM